MVHSGGVERVFSDVTGAKTKDCTRMDLYMLRMISHIEMGASFDKKKLSSKRLCQDEQLKMIDKVKATHYTKTLRYK